MKKIANAKRMNKKEQIVKTAETLFNRYGAKRVTVEEVCQQARVSKMTFYKHFKNKADLVRHIRDIYVEEGFRAFDEINILDIPFADKIDRMTQWKVEFGTRINAEFIREMVSIDDAVAGLKHRFLNHLKDARNNGEIRDDIDPEFLWLVTEKLSELVKEGAWKEVFDDFSQYQYQARTLIFYGLLSRKENEK